MNYSKSLLQTDPHALVRLEHWVAGLSSSSWSATMLYDEEVEGIHRFREKWTVDVDYVGGLKLDG